MNKTKFTPDSAHSQQISSRTNSRSDRQELRSSQSHGLMEESRCHTNSDSDSPEQPLSFSRRSARQIHEAAEYDFQNCLQAMASNLPAKGPKHQKE